MPDHAIVADLPEGSDERSGMEMSNSALPHRGFAAAGSTWVVSAAAGDSTWHVVRRIGGWVLPAVCGRWVCGPFHGRRRNPRDAQVCRGCTAAAA